jgi:para-nitrobenzyl esterase
MLSAVKPAEQAIGPSPTPLFDRYPFGPVVDGERIGGADAVASEVSADVACWSFMTGYIRIGTLRND